MSTLRLALTLPPWPPVPRGWVMMRSRQRLLGLCLFSLLCSTIGCQKKAPGQLPTIHFVPLPTQSSVPLTPATVEQFVDWVSTMPSTQVGDVRQQIARVKSDPEVVDAVAARLSFSKLGSYGRQLIYLSILGEMQNQKALGPLQNYLNSPDCPVFEQRTANLPAPGGPKTSIFDPCAGLKSAAINMIAYLKFPDADALVLQAISSHPSRTVRLSAMNAYLYNHGDSEAALATVRRYARADEVKFVGVPRLTKDTNAKEFAARLARFYNEHPEEKPPLPQHVSRKAPLPGRQHKMSIRPSAAPAGGGK